MKILVTGITGFVGQNLANYLVETGHTVFGMVRPSDRSPQSKMPVVSSKNLASITFLPGNVEEEHSIREIFETQIFDAVFHLAAENDGISHYSNPEHTIEVNALGTIRLADIMAELQPQCRLIFASSSEVYGPVEGYVDETSPFDPQTAYARSKANADLYLQTKALLCNLPYTVVRGWLHVGAPRHERFAISSDARQIALIMKGRQDRVIRVGSLETRRLMVDVRDAARAYELLLHYSVPDKVFNLSGDIIASMGDLLDRMLTMTGLATTVTKIVDPTLVRRRPLPLIQTDSAKLRYVTGWMPIYTIDQTLEFLLQYWISQV